MTVFMFQFWIIRLNKNVISEYDAMAKEIQKQPDRQDTAK